MPPKRQLFVHWLAVILTLSLYGYIWLYLMARDVNSVRGASNVTLNRRAIAFVVLSVIFFVGNGVIDHYVPREHFELYRNVLLLIFVPGVVATIIYLMILLDVGACLRARPGISVPSGVGLVLLTMLFYISLPILQRKLNAINADA